MTRATLHLSLLVLFAFGLSCGGDEIDKEDWDNYADVFSGAGPDNDMEKLYIKLNYENKNDLTGEMEGPFFSKVRGNYEKNGSVYDIEIDTSFRSTHCIGTTYIEFIGTVANNRLTGTLYYRGCNIYDFYYEGARVGGAG